MVNKISPSCPLCLSSNHFLFCTDKNRAYLRCHRCLLVYIEDKFILSSEKEKAIYDLHENDVNDAGYKKFLSRLTQPMEQFIPPESHGLDFGCGPGPALAKMMEAKGFKMSLYDLYYFPDKKKLEEKYDFICSTEVAEHVKDSKSLFDTFNKCLKTNGVLGLMTKLALDKEAFSKWHYKNDPTHIRFFSVETFEWIAKQWNLNVQFFGNDVIILRK